MKSKDQSEQQSQSIERLTVVTDKTIDFPISIDAIIFRKCRFEDKAVLKYNGGITPTFANCTFSPNIRWQIEGGAVWSAIFFRHFKEAFGVDISESVSSWRPTFMDLNDPESDQSK